MGDARGVAVRQKRAVGTVARSDGASGEAVVGGAGCSKVEVARRPFSHVRPMGGVGVGWGWVGSGCGVGTQHVHPRVGTK